MVTLACLPLLVLDVVQGSTTSGAATSEASSESSLVLAVVPSTEEIATTTTVDVSVIETVPATTVAPVVTVAPAVVPAPTTTIPRPEPTIAPIVQSDSEFLACIRRRESNNDYTASDRSGTFLGAYQIYQGGWDSVASRMGRSDLIGIAPNEASPADQDAVALAMLQYHGRAPWGGGCS